MKYAGCLSHRVSRLALSSGLPACLLSWAVASSVPAELVAQLDPSVSHKKIISFRGPTARGLALDIEKMERLLPGIDGVAIYPSTYQGGISTEAVGRMFRKDWHRIEQFEDAIGHLQSVKARATRYKHNFLLGYLTPGDKSREVPDWFDDEFEAVVNNWQVSAQFCQRSGLDGILFDDEVYYGRNLWSYRSSKYQDTKSAQEYADQAFERGAQIMRAINRVFPDIHIISLHGPSQATREVELGDPAVSYGLMAAFFDGLLSESTGGARIVDGHELAYGYRAPVTYARARRVMKQTMRDLSRVPEQYDRHCQAGFAFVIGAYGEIGFSADLATNYYTPDELTWSLHQALKYSDEYVWLYPPHCDLWEKSGKPGIVVPQAYREAITAARQQQVAPPVLRNFDAHVAAYPGSAKPPRKFGAPVPGFPQDDGRGGLGTVLGYDEDQTFGDLWDDHVQLAELSHLWRFRIDPLDVGVEEGWHRPDVEERDWFWITDLLPWDNHGYRTYDGHGWYRQTVVVPELEKDRKVFLAFGAVAHGAEVYVNGARAGSHNMDGWAYTSGDPWKRRFLIDVSPHLHKGAANVITVRVVDYGPWGGGIWKPVKLLTPVPSLHE